MSLNLKTASKTQNQDLKKHPRNIEHAILFKEIKANTSFMQRGTLHIQQARLPQYIYMVLKNITMEQQ